MTFPFCLTPVWKKQSAWQTDGRQSLQTTASPLIWWNVKSRGQPMFIPTTWDSALQFQAPRMINGFANPAGRPTQTRTELIAVRNTLAWRQRKCRRALANRKKKKIEKKKGPGCCSELQVGFCWQEFTPVSINHSALAAETALSHQHAIEWVTDSILTALARFKRDPFKTLPASSNSQEMETRWMSVTSSSTHVWKKKKKKSGKRSFKVLCRSFRQIWKKAVNTECCHKWKC